MADSRYALEEIYWDDAVSLTGWRLGTDPAITLARCMSIGWVIKEDDKMIVLAGTKGVDDEEQGEAEDQFNEVGVIPKGMITSRRVLT